MHDQLQELTVEQAALVVGGDGGFARAVGYLFGYTAHLVVDAFLTPPPQGDFSWATDK